MCTYIYGTIYSTFKIRKLVKKKKTQVCFLHLVRAKDFVLSKWRKSGPQRRIQEDNRHVWCLNCTFVFCLTY